MVVRNEKNGGLRKRQMLGIGLGPWRSRLIYSLNMQFLIKKSLVPFPLVTAKLTGDYFDIKGCGANNDAMPHRSSLRLGQCGPNSQHKS
jgi:hypothetical protein